ncbi:MAG TPA: hypothetical protein VJI68_00085 [Candidatus Nanoarchaeia archaeon]|nr:hypothetical protein [Candidatus Nanoarchaeia archaeon]
MKNKRGQGYAGYILLSLIIGAFAVFLVITALSTTSDLIPGTDVKCSNSKYWSEERGLHDLLENLDNNKETSESFLFINNDCKLVSFTLNQGFGNILLSTEQPREPLLCLCKIERESSSEAVCEPNYCYKFKNFDSINNEQFSTEDLKDYVSLKFIKEGKTLRIISAGDEKQAQPLIYSKSDQTKYLDETGLINRLVIIFNTKQITSYLPIVKLKESGFLIPQEITNKEGFTQLFDLKLSYSKLPGQTNEDYLINAKEIDPNAVKAALIEINLEKSKLNGLNKDKIVLYYKVNNKWAYSKLTCEEASTKFLCKTSLTGFSNQFAISTIEEVA